MGIRNWPATKLLSQMEKNWPEAISPVTELMLRVFRLNKIVWSSSETISKQYGLTLSEFELLMALRREPFPHQLLPGDLCKILFLTSGGLTKMLGRIEDQGYINRDITSKDLRRRPVCLTKLGKNKVETILMNILTKDQLLLDSGLTAEEVTQLTQLLHKLLSAIEKT